MKQLVQNFNDGKLNLEDVPLPVIQKGGVLIRTASSLLSVGTEKMISEFSKKSLVGKALARPDLVKEVLNKVKQEGLLATIPKVKSKLETSIPLGYSCAGKILEVGEGLEGFCVGERVAGAGTNYATHGEYNFVPQNLCVKIPAGVSDDEAAFVALGSIALQGVRQAEVRVGERVVVMGLGLLGLLTVQLLKAAGCQVLGADIDEKKLALAKKIGADEAVLTSKLISAVSGFSAGYGVDAVIITASTSSNELIEIAGEISRFKGKVVVVGVVGMDIPRNLYYKKELDLRLSMSYGPGRYDVNYEEKGIDYPFGYVRWTEKRNMEVFLQLVKNKKVNVKDLITHRFDIEAALRAYELVMGGREFFVGVLLQYPVREEAREKNQLIKFERPVKIAAGKPCLAVIGAGNFTTSVLLPKLQKMENVVLKTLCDIQGAVAVNNAKKFGFMQCTSDFSEVLRDEQTDVVIITTRHNLHAQMVLAALKAGKHVYVEKPLAMNQAELDEIVKLFSGKALPHLLMVGFNRRFSPLVKELKHFIKNLTAPFMVNYRINAGFVPKESWVQDPEIGGGRIIGEVCHFVDLIKFLVNSSLQKVYAEAAGGTHDNVNVTLKFENGSVGNICYVAMADKGFPKEKIEFFGERTVAVIDDFRSLLCLQNGKGKTVKNLSQDKGHAGELSALVEAVRAGGKWPIDLEDMVSATGATFAILDSLNKGQPLCLT